MTWQDPQAVQKFRAAEEVIRNQEGPRTLAVCRRCGMLPWKNEFSDWADLAGAAQGHANTGGRGHMVAVTLVRGDVFRPQSSDEGPQGSLISGSGAPELPQ